MSPDLNSQMTPLPGQLYGVKYFLAFVLAVNVLDGDKRYKVVALTSGNNVHWKIEKYEISNVEHAYNWWSDGHRLA